MFRGLSSYCFWLSLVVWVCICGRATCCLLLLCWCWSWVFGVLVNSVDFEFLLFVLYVAFSGWFWLAVLGVYVDCLDYCLLCLVVVLRCLGCFGGLVLVGCFVLVGGLCIVAFDLRWIGV